MISERGGFSYENPKRTKTEELIINLCIFICLLKFEHKSRSPAVAWEFIKVLKRELSLKLHTLHTHMLYL